MESSVFDAVSKRVPVFVWSLLISFVLLMDPRYRDKLPVYVGNFWLQVWVPDAVPTYIVKSVAVFCMYALYKRILRFVCWPDVGNKVIWGCHFYGFDFDFDAVFYKGITKWLAPRDLGYLLMNIMEPMRTQVVLSNELTNCCDYLEKWLYAINNHLLMR